MENTTLPDVIQGTEPAIDETVTPGTTEPEAEPVTPDPDAPATGKTPEPPPKPSGIDRRISKLTYQAREAERQAAYWRGIAEGKGGAPQGAQRATDGPTDGPPKQEQFETYDEYLRALTRHQIGVEMAQERQRLAKEMEAREAEAQARELRSTFESRAQAFRQKHADFDDVVMSEDLEISGPMRDAIMNLEDGAELAYHFGKNPEEASRIARLHPYHQMLELGRISVRIAAPPPAPKPQASAAPPPITPVRAKAVAVESLTDTVPIGEWMKRRTTDLRKR